MSKELVKELREVDDQLDSARSAIENIRDDVQAEFDDMPEEEQEKPDGKKLERIVELLEEASGEVENAVETLRSLINSI